MQDLTSKREKFLQEAADCELIGNLAVDAKKRETFRNLAVQLKKLADDLEAEIVKRAAVEGAVVVERAHEGSVGLRPMKQSMRNKSSG